MNTTDVSLIPNRTPVNCLGMQIELNGKRYNSLLVTSDVLLDLTILSCYIRRAVGGVPAVLHVKMSHTGKYCMPVDHGLLLKVTDLSGGFLLDGVELTPMHLSLKAITLPTKALPETSR